MLVGAGFWSIYADKRGRRTAFVSSLACVFVGGIFSALSPSLFVLCLCRVLVGFGVGGRVGRTRKKTTLPGKIFPVWTVSETNRSSVTGAIQVSKQSKMAV